VRKALKLEKSNASAGFDAGTSLMNGVLAGLSMLERIPQRVIGTSVMAVLKAVPHKR
jgi:hypothetical protein